MNKPIGFSVQLLGYSKVIYQVTSYFTLLYNICLNKMTKNQTGDHWVKKICFQKCSEACTDRAQRFYESQMNKKYVSGVIKIFLKFKNIPIQF